MTRDVAPRLGQNKPALIESRFFPALQVSEEEVYVPVGGREVRACLQQSRRSDGGACPSLVRAAHPGAQHTMALLLALCAR